MGLCGRSDFEDICSMHYKPEEILEKYQVYADANAIIPLKMESEKDLVAYYPFLVTLMYSNKEEGGCIRLSPECYIDFEERERIQWRYDEVLKYYKKCKRKKEEFDKNHALMLICWHEEPESYQIELVNRIAELGAKATIDDLHDEMHDRMRKQWFELMVENGWNENTAYRWVYGWKRFLQKNNAELVAPCIVQQKLDLEESDGNDSKK